MTPSQQLGYKVGDKFVFTDNTKQSPDDIVKECTGFEKQDILTLAIDDGTSLPVFTGDRCTYTYGPDDTPGAYVHLDLVQPYKE